MKLPLLVAAIACSITLTPVWAEESTETTKFDNDKDKVSYAIGMSIGQNFKLQTIDVNPTMVAKGMNDILTGQKPMLDKKALETTMVNFQKELMAKREAQYKALSEKNVAEGEKYLAENGKKPGVKTTTSGLQYHVITEGTGDKPSKDDTVTVDYEGKLIDGTVFDSSYKRGNPVTFPVSQVIPGWTEVLQLMNKGATVEVVIPAKLAYGEHGVGEVIGPNKTLLFKIHLIDIKKAGAATDNSSKK